MSRVVCAECQEEGRDGCLKCGLTTGVVVAAPVIIGSGSVEAKGGTAVVIYAEGEPPRIEADHKLVFKVKHVSVGEVVDPLCVIHQDPDLASLDPGEKHYAKDAKRCGTCGSSDVKGEGMGCEVWRYVCRTCGADPA